MSPLGRGSVSFRLRPTTLYSPNGPPEFISFRSLESSECLRNPVGTGPKFMTAPAEPDILARNRAFYDDLWQGARLVRPQRFNSWAVVRSLLPSATACLEIAPGLRPRLPIAGSFFVDISAPAVARLRDAGGAAVMADAAAIPFADAQFDLLCAFDVIEHVRDDAAMFAELARLTRPNGALLLSVPLHPDRWTEFDEMVGHCRRYEPELLVERLTRHGFTIEYSARFGSRPKSSRLAVFGLTMITRYSRRAFWCYNHLMMPLALAFQKSLRLTEGFADAGNLDEALLICRKAAGNVMTSRDRA
jgi:SAM-dependent methyltransferase